MADENPHRSSLRVAGATLSVLGALLCADARANDSSAVLSGGRILLRKNTSVVMESEDLRVGADSVDVSYVFYNPSTESVSMRVAFPIRIDLDSPGSEAEAPAQVAEALGFHLLVDGVERHTRTEVRRFPDHELITFHWRQVFPAGKRVAVVHHYSPGGDTWTVGEFLDEELVTRLSHDYCVDPKILKDFLHQFGTWKTVKYILHTGANWARPIRRFQLALRKSAPADGIFSCESGLENSDPLTLSKKSRDFSPRTDLAVLFVEPRAEEPPN
jgi:hypothetical protein